MNAAAGLVWLLVVVGVGGDAAHRTEFDGRAQAFIGAATGAAGVPSEQVIYLAERPDDVQGANGRANAAGLDEAFDRLAGASSPGDTVIVLLIGHGSGREEGGRFNIVGPDLGPADFEEFLQRLPDRRIGFVNTTSASGGFAALGGEGRVVITATANVRETEEPRFGAFFVDAFVDGAADLDKDGAVSLAEAFDYAAREVERYYEAEGRLQPEHALLDDDGDTEGSRAPLAEAQDGAVAARFTLRAAPLADARDAVDDPEVRALVTRRAELQAELDALRAGKDAMDEDVYLDQLESLVLQIAEVDAQLREREVR